MPKRSRKQGKKSRKGGKTKKQNMYVMKGCSKKNTRKNNKKVFSSLGNSMCVNCGPNCFCGPNCNCPHKCPGNCYLNRPIKKGGEGCGPGGCPIPPFSWAQMNAVQGGSKLKLKGKKLKGGLKYPPPNNVMKTGVILPYDKIALGSIGQIGSGNGQVGGSCGQTCGLLQSGGSFYKSGSPMPGPFVGSSWGTSVSKWPGVDGMGGNRNYLKDYDAPKNNIVVNDPALQQLTSDIDAGYKTLSSYVGGYKYKNKEKSGGGLIPQDLVNLGQDFTFNLKSAYNTLNGYNAPVNPLPYKDQLNHSLNNNKLIL
jgi:hypothetical protein